MKTLAFVLPLTAIGAAALVLAAGPPQGLDAGVKDSVISACALLAQPDVEKLESSSETRDSFINLLDEQSYNALKRGSSESFKFLTSFLSLGANASYQEFSEKRSSKYQLSSGDSRAKTYENVFRKTLPVERAKLYVECLANANNSPGFRGMAVPQGNRVVVTYSWKNPPRVNELTIESSQVVGGKALDPSIPQGQALATGKVFPSNSLLSVVYERTPTEDFIITASTKEGYALNPAIIVPADRTSNARSTRIQVALDRVDITDPYGVKKSANPYQRGLMMYVYANVDFTPAGSGKVTSNLSMRAGSPSLLSESWDEGAYPLNRTIILNLKGSEIVDLNVALKTQIPGIIGSGFVEATIPISKTETGWGKVGEFSIPVTFAAFGGETRPSLKGNLIGRISLVRD